MAKEIMTDKAHGFEWGAVIAGSVVALALTVVLMQFGTALGYSGEIDVEDKDLTHWTVIALGLWVLFVQIISSLTGAYVAGYMSKNTPELLPHTNEMRDGIYGVCVWALSTITVFVATTGLAALAALSADPDTVENVANTMTDQQENAVIIAGFALGAISMLSIALSWWASVMGGHHRLTGADFSSKMSFLK